MILAPRRAALANNYLVDALNALDRAKYQVNEKQARRITECWHILQGIREEISNEEMSLGNPPTRW